MLKNVEYLNAFKNIVLRIKVFRARSRENTVSLFWANASIIRGKPENPKIEKEILFYNLTFYLKHQSNFSSTDTSSFKKPNLHNIQFNNVSMF
jgi:hypothetical protein